MQKIHFSKEINASREKVWKALWDHDSYKEWTNVFAEGSYAQTNDWKEGTKVLFLDTKGSGMVSMVARNKPNEFMPFKHLGIVKNGIEDTTSESVQSWAGAMENYTLTEENGKTNLIVDMDSTDDFKDYFLKTWPTALDKIKDLAEKN